MPSKVSNKAVGLGLGSPRLQELMTERWYPLRPHPEHARLQASDARFKTVVAGRRSGKTELHKRKLVVAGINFSGHDNGRFLALGPTQDQAKEIWWEDLKALTPSWAMAGPPRESPPQTLYLWNGARIQVFGMDRPQRVEGSPVDGAVWDEFADSKPVGWSQSLRPALSTIGRPGWCSFIGKPKGAGTAFHKLAKAAQRDQTGRWAHFHWDASELLDPDEVAELARDLDQLTFDQEVRGLFVSFEGRAYYAFEREVHAAEYLGKLYDPRAPLYLCFDFNVDPGVCSILQEVEYEGKNPAVPRREPITVAIGEVWIERASNTPRVCRKLIEDWGGHQGRVVVDGDPAGGARSTKSEDGSDYDIIADHLAPVFGDRLSFEVARSAPKERLRVNSVNARLRSASGQVRHLVCPVGAPHLADDYEAVTVVPGTNGELLKEPGSELTHISDGTGYWMFQNHPALADGGGSMSQSTIGGR